jgi:hypothetical protein
MRRHAAVPQPLRVVAANHQTEITSRIVDMPSDLAKLLSYGMIGERRCDGTVTTRTAAESE